ncbi:MAG: biopolymer transporter ExbD [Candidatus Pacebacteria bacterium]|nr:biopolymer transporter ExbD [Candidatus Paceibacterota bacterium]
MPRRQRTELESFSGINITPLMDLTFLLLIVFMITAPMLEYAVDVSPPEMNAETIQEKDNILINLSSNGTVRLGREQVSPSELIRQLENAADLNPDVTVLIRADESRPYREVVDLMRTVRNAGLFNLSLVTQPEE